MSDEAVDAARSGLRALAQQRMAEAGRASLVRPADDPVAPFVLANWAQSLLAQGLWESAEAVARGAAARAELVDDVAVRMRAWRIVGESRRLTGRSSEAADAFRVANDLRDLVPDSEAEEVAELDFGRGLLALETDDLPGAVLALSRAVGVAVDRSRADLELRSRLALMEALLRQDRAAEAEFELELAGKRANDARARADVLQRRAALELARGETGAADVAVETMLTEAGRWIDDAPGATERASRAREARGYVETALDIRLFADGSPAASTAWPGAADWIRRVQGASPLGTREDEADALWFWGSQRVVGWLTPSGGVPRVVDAGDPDTLREWTLLFRSLLASPSREEERRQTGRWLTHALFNGVIPAGATLRLEPDGPLEALPFALLPDGDERLGVSRAIVQGSVGQSPASNPESRTPGCLVLADPTPPVGAPVTAPLPGAREEGRRIAARVSGTRVLAGNQAMEARVAGATVPAILHIAAHSSPDPDDPALLLATGEGRDGWLRPEEIRGLPRVPQIVVLSSCESLLTDVSGRTSVGQVGSAFLDAGASTVVGALWKVEDGAPGTFLAAFHAGIGEGLRPSESMRRARLTVAASEDSALNDPFAWGAYVVRGRDEPLLEPAREAAGAEDRRAGAWLGYASALAMITILGSRRFRRRADAP